MTVIVFLHFLGGSARSWRWVIAAIGAAAHCVTIDLPGFGDAAASPGNGVADMADRVAAAIRAEHPSRFVLVGHSMGAKVAAAVARIAEDGGLPGLARIVLIAGSPPSPEPMDEAQRETMLGWFDGTADQEQADGFIRDNVSAALTPERHDLAVADVLRADAASWRAWLHAGSREDWADRVGVLHTPCLLISGADDPYLGPDGQARVTAPHFSDLRHVTLSGAKHLLPLERSDEVARLILEHLA